MNTILSVQTKEAYDYLKMRSSKLIDFSFESQVENLNVMLNPSLYHWTIENLVKNGIDAMKGKGSIRIEIIPDGKYVNIQVTDTGHGIPKSDHTRPYSILAFHFKKKRLGAWAFTC